MQIKTKIISCYLADGHDEPRYQVEYQGRRGWVFGPGWRDEYGRPTEKAGLVDHADFEAAADMYEAHERKVAKEIREAKAKLRKAKWIRVTITITGPSAIDGWVRKDIPSRQFFRAAEARAWLRRLDIMEDHHIDVVTDTGEDVSMAF